ncbi:hypothetical protein HETIRDRAFT_327988 [Heterobasidion irregulare TC 32-1]|uniref:DUF2470 domain-containing protein n=1 Tax=Heterobasidion irregulare (strain TC 32-1) TaxID=747525 RepID=W4JTH7_HETIT|nr:uncharacterized protein HETIRDRAFT_327988 [Heterobasidion irregulare TC 32-1]ETW76764.1 hypothetical protein HETIRDRAFT_327988 [Heterobasidion irregulare TC 32-1]
MTDPVADKSGFLCMYMSSHPDTLVSYAKHYGQIREHITSAKMESIDSQGMKLSYQTKANSSRQSVHVPFNPPLAGYEEVKPRLLSMKADADEALGTAKAPPITSFRLPLRTFQTFSLISFLVYTTYAPVNDPSPVWAVGQFLHSLVGGQTTMAFIWVFLGVVHAGEGLYATLLAKKHQMPFSTAISYITAITIFGYPVLLDLRSRIQTARIESIMKGQ